MLKYPQWNQQTMFVVEYKIPPIPKGGLQPLLSVIIRPISLISVLSIHLIER
ncbi:hypothetical protein BGS_0554 [Beggiatoa sp. SS]|nr:hypothetical protein BGS_0554 [Beggiatoa sp. SS]